MTTRKHFPRVAPVVALAAVALCGGGCATPGPLHVYSVVSTAAATVHDAGPDGTAEVASFVAPTETLTGFAYDPFTDHFFLRLAPGNRIRVVDRPAHAVKRSFELAELARGSGGDLAVRPRDGHVFALEPTLRAVVELTRYGEFIRRVALDSVPGPAAGIAYDTARDRLLVLSGDVNPQVTAHTLEGKLLSSTPLDRAVTPASLAYDSGKKEIYAPLAAGRTIGVFGADGKLRRELPVQATFIDVGPRSLLRMF